VSAHPVGRIRKLVLLLGSPYNNEVVAVAPALIRYLAGLGLDLHHLCGLIELGANPPSPPPQAPVRADEWQPVARNELHALALFIRANHRFDRLAPRAQEFVADMCGWLEHKDATEGQERWLRSMVSIPVDAAIAAPETDMSITAHGMRHRGVGLDATPRPER
jgi:hypothetical protein